MTSFRLPEGSAVDIVSRVLRKVKALPRVVSKSVSRGRYDRMVTDALSVTPGRLLNVGCGSKSYTHIILGDEVRVDLQDAGAPDLITDAQALPFKQETFGIVLMEHVIHDCSIPHAAIGEARRVLRPGGSLIMTAPFLFPEISEHDKFRFTQHGLTSLLGDFASIQVEPQYEGWGALGVLVARLETERGLAGLVGVLLLPIALLLKTLDPILNRMIPLRSYGSGFFVTAVK